MAEHRYDNLTVSVRSTADGSSVAYFCPLCHGWHLTTQGIGER